MQLAWDVQSDWFLKSTGFPEFASVLGDWDRNNGLREELASLRQARTLLEIDESAHQVGETLEERQHHVAEFPVMKVTLLPKFPSRRVLD